MWFSPSPVSVQKCHNAPICGLFVKLANFIFKFLSLKISLIQADCHWKQVLVVRSTRFHGLEQSLEILPERDSDLLASLDKGIVHCRSQCTLNTTKEQRALALYGLGTYRSFCCQVIYGIFTIVSIGKDLLPKLMEIVTAGSLFHCKDPNEEELFHSPSLYAPWHPSPVLLPTDGSSLWHLPTGSQQFSAFSLYQ